LNVGVWFGVWPATTAPASQTVTLTAANEPADINQRWRI
jgi:hypothetical protein